MNKNFVPNEIRTNKYECISNNISTQYRIGNTVNPTNISLSQKDIFVSKLPTLPPNSRVNRQKPSTASV